MRTTEIGDRVQAHYTKKFSDGSVRSSRARGSAPLSVTVGTAHPRLPGLLEELVGVAEGQTVTLNVPPESAYGMPDPNRIHRVDRARFHAADDLIPGRDVWMRLTRGRTRRVRVVEVRGRIVVVDTNHPRSGQSIELKVEVVAIVAPTPGALHKSP